MNTRISTWFKRESPPESVIKVLLESFCFQTLCMERSLNNLDLSLNFLKQSKAENCLENGCLTEPRVGQNDP